MDFQLHFNSMLASPGQADTPQHERRHSTHMSLRCINVYVQPMRDALFRTFTSVGRSSTVIVRTSSQGRNF